MRDAADQIGTAVTEEAAVDHLDGDRFVPGRFRIDELFQRLVDALSGQAGIIKNIAIGRIESRDLQDLDDRLFRYGPGAGKRTKHTGIAFPLQDFIGAPGEVGNRSPFALAHEAACRTEEGKGEIGLVAIADLGKVLRFNFDPEAALVRELGPCLLQERQQDLQIASIDIEPFPAEIECLGPVADLKGRFRAVWYAARADIVVVEYRQYG